MVRGEVWAAVWPADPGKKERPVLVVSNNIRNRNPYLLDVVVAKVTSAERAAGSIKPINPAEDEAIVLKKASIVKCAALFSVEKSTLRRKLTDLSPGLMTQVDAKLRNLLNLP